MQNDEIEKDIQAAGLEAPRVTPANVEASIVSAHFFTALQGVLGEIKEGGNGGEYDPKHEVPKSVEALGLLTFCVLVLRNGFTVTGESACASPENFNAEIGRKIARQKAVDKIWPLLGFRLRDQLADGLYHAKLCVKE